MHSHSETKIDGKSEKKDSLTGLEASIIQDNEILNDLAYNNEKQISEKDIDLTEKKVT